MLLFRSNTEGKEHDDIAIVTQMTADRLPVLKAMAESWQGYISVAILVQSREDVEQIYRMRNESLIVYQNVDFHVVHGEEVTEAKKLTPITHAKQTQQKGGLCLSDSGALSSEHASE